MLDYKNIIIKHYALSLSGSEIARQLGASKSGVNDFLRAFDKCESLSYPLPPGITNYGIAELVYGSVPGSGGRNENIEYPDYEADAKLMATRKNMTLVFLWNRYSKKCAEEGKRFYQYRQYCELYNKWCEENYETSHFDAVIAQKMEVDFAGQTFAMRDPLTGEILPIVVFVAILPYSQYIYAEGMLSTKEPQWIEVNNHALDYFGGVPALVVCDNCKQAVIVNQDWIEPELNKDYADWADHYGTAILPAKVRKPKFKSSVENAVGILEKGFFHKLEERQYFSLEQFNKDLWNELEALNKEPFKKKEHNRYYYWEEEKLELMPLPSMHYEYMERKTAKVSSDIRKYLLRHLQLLFVFILLPVNSFVNGPEPPEKASGLQIRNICQIIIKDLPSGMVPSLSKKHSLLERIRKLLSALFLNPGCMKSRPTACVLAF